MDGQSETGKKSDVDKPSTDDPDHTTDAVDNFNDGDYRDDVENKEDDDVAADTGNAAEDDADLHDDVSKVRSVKLIVYLITIYPVHYFLLVHL